MATQRNANCNGDPVIRVFDNHSIIGKGNCGLKKRRHRCGRFVGRTEPNSSSSSSSNKRALQTKSSGESCLRSTTCPEASTVAISRRILVEKIWDLHLGLLSCVCFGVFVGEVHAESADAAFAAGFAFFEEGCA